MTMNQRSRHDKRRVQFLKNPCYCAVHKGGPIRGRVTHAMAGDRIAEVRYLGTSVITGPWYGQDGNVIDPTVETRPATPSDGEWFSNKQQRFRLSARIRALRAENRRSERMCRSAAMNPNYPPRGWFSQVADWYAQGAVDVTPSGPVFAARLASD